MLPASLPTRFGKHNDLHILCPRGQRLTGTDARYGARARVPPDIGTRAEAVALKHSQTHIRSAGNDWNCSNSAH